MTLTELCRSHSMTLQELSDLIGRKRDTVKKWGRERRIPAEAVPGIVRAFNGAITAHDLRPDVFEAPAPRRKCSSGEHSHTHSHGGAL
ncbi:transcriptional regulator [Azospirillum canadense]|uniref:transcriptional regulator n=1 Tax=Azospirillum canadense TaxID=403962 RepID=UPI0022263064|nr:helix-turn-helix domain-containing protein [Azospirillum canadense]MCW2242779.1 DNA-binding transcriptional regulator YdaS (Cro superfamily) [Azospirillum canadense]